MPSHISKGTGLVLLLGCLSALSASSVTAQNTQSPPESTEDTELSVPQSVDVEPVNEDSDIAVRLTRIMEATEWFEQPAVTVDEGVVFLQGKAKSNQQKEWAGQLASKTKDVVAVVNRIEILEKPIWDLSPAWQELEVLSAELVRNIPLILVGLVLLVATWWVSKWAVVGSRHVFQRRLRSQLLSDVAARTVAVPVFLLGLYLVLRVSGLTRLAVTVLGGTGLVGLVIGFAFKDIAENFLASVLISMQHPFTRGDLIEVAQYKGYVQSVNTRATLLMTMDGNHVQIPNSTIYKETIVNYTANPNGRFQFSVGIGYEDSIAEAQSIALRVLREHSAVLAEPEPLILVEDLGPATVNLTVFFWTNIQEYSGLKVRSAVIRRLKHAFDEAGISMPDEAREVVFPAGVPVKMLSEDAETPPTKPTTSAPQPVKQAAEPHDAEGDLASEAGDIRRQAAQARDPEPGSDLLD